MNADDVEEWTWNHVMDILSNPDIIAAEAENQRESGAFERLQADKESAERRLARIESNQADMLASFRRSQENDGGFPWHLVEREIRQAEKDKQALRDMIEGIEAQLSEQHAMVERLDDLRTFCERVADRLGNFDFENKRLALEALDITVYANGKDWRVDGAITPDSDHGGEPSSMSTGAVQYATIRFHRATIPMAAD